MPVLSELAIADIHGGPAGPKTGASNDSTSTEDVLPAIGTKILRRLPGTQKITKSRDSNVVFVAGATGRVGSRVVRCATGLCLVDSVLGYSAGYSAH